MAAQKATDGVASESHWLGLTRTEILLAVTVLLVVGTLIHPYRAQQASRYTLTAAIVERGTIVIDDYSEVLGRDRAVRDGHIYSDKAPGQPFLAVPFYAVGKLFGVEDATVLRVEGNLGLWWVTFWSAAVPGAALAVMMYRRVSSRRCRGSLFATLSIFAGTILLPFSALLFGHVLAAAFVYGSFLLLTGGGGRLRLALSGLLAGLSVSVEYTAVLGVLVLFVYVVWRLRWSVVIWVAGGAPIALLLAVYNWIAFGDPFTLSYQYSAFRETAEASRQVFAMFDAASLNNIFRLLFHGRGLLVATPIVVVAVVSAILALRRGPHDDSGMAVAMFFVFLLLPIFWANPWGGASPGPRYMLAAFPFLAFPAARALERWPRVTIFASAISVLTMTAATLTEPIVPRDSADGLNTWLQRLVGGETTDSLFTLALGDAGWLLYLGLAVASVWLLVASHRRRCDAVESV